MAQRATASNVSAQNTALQAGLARELGSMLVADGRARCALELLA